MTPETVIERFDRLAEEFKQDTGYYAPGKDIPSAEIILYNFEQEAERVRLWRSWNRAYQRGMAFANLGPPKGM